MKLQLLEKLNVDMEGATNVEGISKTFKNPGKLMNMVKNVGSKLDEKLKSVKKRKRINEGE